jgi:hypothetical protein
MKPRPQYDFSVEVWPDSADYPSSAGAWYADIYSVTLNRSISIAFVPEFERFPWPPGLPADVDDVRSCDEARRTTVALSRYVVTPDDARRASVETIPDEEDTTRSMFYVGTTEFDELVRELEALAATMKGIHDSIPISQLNGTALARMLLDRILPSGQLTERELYMLGRR